MKNTVPIFLLTGILFIVLGSIIYIKSKEIEVVEFYYNDDCTTLNDSCTVTFDVENEMKSFFFI